MALDEVEWIRTDEPVLEECLKHHGADLRSTRGDTFAGPRLAALLLAGAAAIAAVRQFAPRFSNLRDPAYGPRHNRA
jgi:hypothetical protein